MKIGNNLTIQDVFNSFPVKPSGNGKKIINEAYKFAKKAHSGQKRASGAPYIQHCLATAKILASLGMDARTVAGGLLHDVPEDTEITLAEVEKVFGKDIANMIEGITKLGKMKLKLNEEEVKLENWRRMFLAMAEDIRTVIIKLADRLHNMSTLEYLRPEKRIRIANETMEIYVPIANRLGMSKIQNELSTLCFMHLEPEEYKKTKNLRDKLVKESEIYVEETIKIIKKLLATHNVNYVDIHGRTKELFSLYKKLQKYDGNVNRIYDVLAFRIILNSETDCYKTLGIIHSQYKPMVGRVKDYIALPKPNGYQSLHTTIFGPNGRLVEIQIRTQKMHDEAEIGIAAHWLYKEKNNSQGWRKFLKPKNIKEENKKEIEWVKKLREWQKDLGNSPDEFLEGLKVDFLKNHIFAFTPKGDVIELPEEASVIDFAYAIHTEVGNKTIAAKINGKIASLESIVRNADMIEIITDKNRQGPNADWLKFVKTSHAKNSIRKYIKKQAN